MGSTLNRNSNDQDRDLLVFGTAGLFVPGTHFSNVSQADSRCMSDTFLPVSGRFRAMVVSAGTRVASTTPAAGDGQIDWVIAPGRRYVRAVGGSLIQKANSAGLFDFPLQNSFDSVLTAAWTGLRADWTTDVNCTSWGGAGTGAIGDQQSLNSSALNSGTSACGTNNRLICIEQPEPYLRIYVTSLVYRPGTDFTNLGVADAFCMADPTYPGSGIFKALAGAAGIRVGSVTANAGDGQFNWILKPHRTYVRAGDNVLVNRTSATSLFAFPFQNPLTNDVTAYAWTGLNADWTMGNNCTSWTNSGGTGVQGDASSSNSNLLSAAPAVACGTPGRLICVEQ